MVVDASEVYLKAGDAVDIPIGSAHRIMNTGTENLVFIEIQTGDYLGEDDIERLQDDYGRVH
ncbi:MAG: Alginate biosynthesis protein AlgA [Syntrophorhabdus sp. PtaU1.Bin153]|nr:MAG: Alginate biosynthesis protein AlgA [Syntrophorhabdus sp. PtaU1.Bin153]